MKKKKGLPVFHTCKLAWFAVVSLLSIGTSHGQTLFVANSGNNFNNVDTSIGEFDAVTGDPINFGTLSKGNNFTQPWGLAISGNTIFCSNPANGSIVAVDATTGAQTPLVAGLSYPALGLAVSGTTLFVSLQGTNSIGEYNTSTGAPVNGGTLVSGLSGPVGLAVSGMTLYVANQGNSTIGEYNVSTGTGPALALAGLSGPAAIAISGTTLYVANAGVSDNNTITEYDLNTGTELNGGNPLVTGLGSNSDGLAIYDNTLYVSTFSDDTISAFNASTGAELNGGQPLISNNGVNPPGVTPYLDAPVEILVIPEPSTGAMLLIALGIPAMGFRRNCRG